MELGTCHGHAAHVVVVIVEGKEDLVREKKSSKTVS